MKIAFTVCNRHQLREALCLRESLLRHNPTYRFILGWVDPAQVSELPVGVEVVGVESLSIQGWETMTARYFDFELVQACRPFFADYILKTQPACKELIFLAPTTFVYHSFDSIVAPSAFFQLTPHRVGPQRKGSQPDDKAILNNGMFTSGSWIMHPDGQERRLLDWWSKRTHTRAFLDLCEGMNMDQGWLDYIPVYFDQVKIIRNPSWHCGVYSWDRVDLTLTDGAPYANGKNMISIDFAGLESFHPVWSNYTDSWGKQKPWGQLRKMYRNQLATQLQGVHFEKEPYGKPNWIKPNRIYRKKGVNLIKSLIKKIETYDLTYN